MALHLLLKALDWQISQDAIEAVPCSCKGAKISIEVARDIHHRLDLLRATMMPPEKTTLYIASTPTVDETIGSRPTAAQPLNRALDATFVRKSTRKYVKNLQAEMTLQMIHIAQSQCQSQKHVKTLQEGSNISRN